MWLIVPQPSVPQSMQGVAESWDVPPTDVSQDLLQQDSKYLLKEKEVQTTSLVQELEIGLLGFVEEKGQVVAVINVDGQSQRLMVGDLLPDGSSLDAIVDHSIMLSKDGKVRLIPLYKKEN